MKIYRLLAIALVVLFSSATFADDTCTNTCDSEYRECKNVAESGTAKQACEDDLKQCKNDCK
jgi:hypothetical protein